MRPLLITLLAVLALLTASCSGGAGPSTPPGPTIPAGPPPPPPLISKALEPSSSDQTLSWNDKITVSIPAGLLESKQTLAIAPPQDVPPPTFKGIGEMAGYTVTLGNLREFKKPLTIEIAYDPAKLPEELAPQKALFASYWDPGQKLWVYMPVTVDPQRKVVTIKTNHLSTWKVYYIVRGYGVKESDHFLVVYDRQTAAIVGSSQVSARPFADDLSNYLEQAYAAYARAGFKMPSGQTHVFVDKNTSESQRYGLTGNVYFAMTHDSAQTLKHEAAHELFHVVQNRYYWVYGMGWRGWWTEATADFAAYEVVWNKGTELSDLDNWYFRKSITAHDGGHEYRTANFVAFLAGRGMDFKGAWDAVAEDGRLNVLRPLEAYVQSKTKTSLHDHFRHFVRYALFDPAGPLEKLELEGLPKDLLYSGLIDNPDFLEPDRKEASYTFSLKPDYTAAVWGLRVQAKDDKTPRSLHMEITGTPPPASQVQADVVVLRNDVRPQGGATPRGTLDASSTKLGLSVVKHDVVYIVAVNSSGSAQQLTVKITEEASLTIDPDKATLVPRGKTTFTVRVTGGAPGAAAQVTWSVTEGATGGDINQAGQYTAPSKTGVYHVTATLSTDKTKQATATVTVAPVDITLRPSTATVPAGGKQAFVAEVSGNPDKRVTWKVEESDGGAITADGVYTAPNRQGTYHVIATSRADAAQTARASVSVIVPTRVIVPTPTPLQFTLSVSPSQVVLVPGGKQEFRASLVGLSDTRVQWGGIPDGPIQPAEQPVTFVASSLGDYVVRVTSVADPTKWAEAKVKVVPGVCVLVDRTETKWLNGFKVPEFPKATGSLSFGGGSATVTNQSGPAVSKWNLTWTEPPTRLALGQKFSVTVTIQDAGSVYNFFALNGEGRVRPSSVGSCSIRTLRGREVSDHGSVAAGGDIYDVSGKFFRPSSSRSFEITAPPGGAEDPPLLEIHVVVTASVSLNKSGTADISRMGGEVVYKYELRP